MKQQLIIPLLLGISIALATESTSTYEWNPSEEITAKESKELTAFAEAGDATAALELFRRYKHGRGVEKNLLEGAKWARVVEKTDPDVLDTNINTPEQLENLKEKANAGDQQALYELAWRYEDGLGALIEKDLPEAAKWYQKLAESGNRRGMMWMGRNYKSGNAGLEKDYSRALAWFHTCLDLTDLMVDQQVEVLIEIIDLYQTGHKTYPKNETKAKERIERANRIALEGKSIPYARAQYTLACAYDSGQILPHDPVKALALFEESGTNGRWPASMERAAAAYYKGRGTPVDKAMAREWIEKLKNKNPHRSSEHFARNFPPSEYKEALEWVSAETTVAEELNTLYEKAYFLETAKGQTKEALEAYRSITETKATHGTYPIIAKALERMLAFYSDPKNDPVKQSHQIARTYLEFCKQRSRCPALALERQECNRLTNTIPELKMLQELVNLHDHAIEEVLKKDAGYCAALKDYSEGKIGGQEFDKIRNPIERRLYNDDRDPEFIRASKMRDKSWTILRTRTFEYWIADYEKQGKPILTDWIENISKCEPELQKLLESKGLSK